MNQNNNKALSTPVEVMCSVFFAIVFVFCGLAYVFMWIC